MCTCTIRALVQTTPKQVTIHAVFLNKIDTFHGLLEESAFRLTDRRHIADLVPFVLSQEVDQIEAEMGGCPLSVIFDGTTHSGEAMVVVVRFVDADFNIHQHLLQIAEQNQC